jgi:hypothetical protein
LIQLNLEVLHTSDFVTADENGHPLDCNFAHDDLSTVRVELFRKHCVVVYFEIDLQLSTAQSIFQLLNFCVVSFVYSIQLILQLYNHIFKVPGVPLSNLVRVPYRVFIDLLNIKFLFST